MQDEVVSLSDDRVVVVKKTAGELMVTIKHKEDNNKFISSNFAF